MSEPDNPTLIILAGPNGAGKSTVSEGLLDAVPGLCYYLNPDRIAKGIAPRRPELVSVQAGRILLDQFDRLVRRRATFAFETTLSGKGYIARCKAAQAAGYRIRLIYLMLESARESFDRVNKRSALGGHSVPQADIFRRYSRSMTHLFQDYMGFVDEWELQQSIEGHPPRLVACKAGKSESIFDKELYEHMRGLYGYRP